MHLSTLLSLYLWVSVCVPWYQSVCRCSLISVGVRLSVSVGVGAQWLPSPPSHQSCVSKYIFLRVEEGPIRHMVHGRGAYFRNLGLWSTHVTHAATPYMPHHTHLPELSSVVRLTMGVTNGYSKVTVAFPQDSTPGHT